MENIAELSATAAHAVRSPWSEMREQQAAFDLIPYAEAARRACVALRDAEGAVSVVLGDPFDLDTQDWIEERLAAPFRYRLASREDVAAYLAQQEDRLSRAGRGFARNPSGNDQRAAPRKSPSKPPPRPTARWCKLVSSTLYDALKAGASDVHLESTASGLTIKYRIDGVLTAGRVDARHRARRAGDLAHQGDVGARHRRAPRAAGRPLQGAQDATAATSTSASR